MQISLARQPVLNAREVAPEFYRKLIFVLVVLGTLSLAISLAGRLFGGHVILGGNSSNTNAHEIIIANVVLNVPENYIRHRDQRSQGVKSHLELYALWPSLSGYSNEDRIYFDNEQKDQSKLLFISIEPQQMSRDMSGRFDPIYRQLIDPIAQNTATEGLESYTFKKDRAIFANERLFVGDRGSESQFVARCITGADGDHAIAPCERDVFMTNDLSVKYRFPFWLLQDYRTLDARVLGLVEKLIVNAPAH